MFSVLFVCTGNTCRSPMAEQMLRSRIAAAGLQDQLESLSAGLTAWEGSPAAPEAVWAMGRMDISLAEHRAKRLNITLLEQSGLVLAMTGSHRDEVLRRVPQVKEKIFLLSEYAGESGDVTDPLGGSETEYQACSEILAAYLDKIWTKIVERAANKE